MKRSKPGVKILIYLLIWLMALPSGVLAQGSAETTAAPEFSKEELAQMLAPIALYPDALLAQMLMASTYPLEVVQAARWIEKHPDLKGDQLDAALIEQGWDVSVKSMTHFPDIMEKMNERIDETARLGDAFLAQEGDMMDTVQELRTKAKAEGYLETTQEQKVIVQETVIVIEPANPQVIYVPTYSPTVVYGPWWYPAYPPYRPYYPYYPDYSGGIAIGFTTGFFVGAAVGSWCRFGWNHRRIDVDINRTVNFNRNVNINRGGGHQGWKHNPSHRKGVPYKDRRTSQRYGQRPSRSRDARRNAPGYDRGGTGARTRDRTIGDGNRGKPGASVGRSGSRGPGSREKTAAGIGKPGSAKNKAGGRAQAGSLDRQRRQSSKQMRSGSMQRKPPASRGSSAYSGMSSRGSSSRASQRGQSSRSGSRSGGGGRMKKR